MQLKPKQHAQLPSGTLCIERAGFSHLVEIVEHLICLLVSDDTLVGALHLIEEHDVDVGLGALAETSGYDQSVEEVRVRLDVLELGLRGSVNETTPQASVGRLRTHICYNNVYNL